MPRIHSGVGCLITPQNNNANNIGIRDYESVTNTKEERNAAFTSLSDALSTNNQNGADNDAMNALFKACVEFKQVRDENFARYGLFLPSYKHQQQEALTNVMNALDAVISSGSDDNNAGEIRNALLRLLRTVYEDGSKRKISPQLQNLMKQFNFSASSLTAPQKLWLQQNNLVVTSNTLRNKYQDIINSLQNPRHSLQNQIIDDEEKEYASTKNFKTNYASNEVEVEESKLFNPVELSGNHLVLEHASNLRVKMVESQLQEIATGYINSRIDQDLNDLLHTIKTFVAQHSMDLSLLIPVKQEGIIINDIWDLLNNNLGNDLPSITHLSEWCKYELFAFPNGESDTIIPDGSHSIITALEPGLRYTFFIDRMLATIKSKEELRKDRKYGAQMFTDRREDCAQEYLYQCFVGVNIMFNSGITFIQSQNGYFTKSTNEKFIDQLTCNHTENENSDSENEDFSNSVLSIAKSGIKRNNEVYSDIAVGDVVSIDIDGKLEYLECIEINRCEFQFCKLELNEEYSQHDDIGSVFQEKGKYELFVSNDGYNTFALLESINISTRSITDNRHLSIVGLSVSGPEGNVHLYYGFDIDNHKAFLKTFPDTIAEKKGIESRYFAPNKLLNECCRFQFARGSKETRQNMYMGNYPRVHAGLTVLSRYSSRLQIVGFYSRQLRIFRLLYNKAINSDQKIATIILFISILEACHYFSDGNNRLFCQILLNKLLLEAGENPTILKIPNGFSRAALSMAPETVRFEGMTADINLDELVASYKILIDNVREGQDFYQFIRQQDMLAV